MRLDWARVEIVQMIIVERVEKPYMEDTRQVVLHKTVEKILRAKTNLNSLSLSLLHYSPNNLIKLTKTTSSFAVFRYKKPRHSSKTKLNF